MFNGDDPTFAPVGLVVPSFIHRISSDGNLIFTADGNSLIIYQVHALPTVPVTAQA